MQPNLRHLRIPESQGNRSPDTTVETVDEGQNQSNTQRSTNQFNTEPLSQYKMPTTKEEIKKLLPNDPLKRFRIERLFKAAMPTTVRKRKFEEIMNSNEVDGLTESQQERMVRSFIQEELKNRLHRHSNAGKRRRINSTSNSSNNSFGSFSESIGKIAPAVFVPPRNALSQNAVTPVVTHVSRRQVPLTDSLSSSDSSNVDQENQTNPPERPPTPDFEPLAPPPRRPQSKPKKTAPQPSRDQQVPSPPRSRRSSNDGTAHSNMGAPSRPTIPHMGATGVAVRSSKEIHGA
jgi:stress-induced morphogen